MGPLGRGQENGSPVMLGEIGTEGDLSTDRPDRYKIVAPGSSLNDEADARPAAHHFERVNLAFMDGHEQPLRLEQFYRNQTPVDRWFAP